MSRTQAATESKIPPCTDFTDKECLREVLLETIDEHKSVRGAFFELLWTHQTTPQNFTLIVTNPKRHCLCPLGKTAEKRGVQFRYGKDSQYGPITFVMKRDFARGLRGRLKEKFAEFPNDASQPVVNNLRPPLWCRLYDNECQTYLAKVARDYDFRFPRNVRRSYDIQRASVCEKLTDDEALPSWCNPQLQIAEDVPFSGILAVMLPEHVLQSIPPKSQWHRSFKDVPLIVITAVDPKKDYYAFVAPNPKSRRGSDKAIRTLVYRDFHEYKGQSGNTSEMATSLREFEREEEIYMQLLVEQDLFDTLPSFVSADPVPKENSKTEEEGEEGIWTEIGDPIPQ